MIDDVSSFGGGVKRHRHSDAPSLHVIKSKTVFTNRPRERAASPSQNIASSSSDYAISYIDIGVRTFSKGS